MTLGESASLTSAASEVPGGTSTAGEQLKNPCGCKTEKTSLISAEIIKMAETGDLLWNQNCSRRIERLEMHYHEHEADAFHWHDRPVFEPWDMGDPENIPALAEC